MFFANRRARFEAAVRTYSADLYRFAFWCCGDRFVAEDLVQDALARAWQGWRDLKDESAVKAWLFTILRRENARRFERKQLEIVEDQVLDQLMANCDLQAGVELEQALRALPDTYREPLLLQVVGGFSVAEVASILSLSEAAVMTRVSRARKALRRLAEVDQPLRERAP